MNKKGLSFNATFGPIVALVTIILMYLGIMNDSELLILIAGYLSITCGLVLIINTFATSAYIGTVMRPIMWLCMVLLLIIGAVIVYSPLNESVKSSIPNFNIISLYSLIVILVLAMIHIVTNK